MENGHVCQNKKGWQNEDHSGFWKKADKSVILSASSPYLG